MDPIQNAIHWTLSYKSNLLLGVLCLFVQTGSEEQSLKKIQSAPHEGVWKELARNRNTKDYFLKYSRLRFMSSVDAVVSKQYLFPSGTAQPQVQQLLTQHKLGLAAAEPARPSRSGRRNLSGISRKPPQRSPAPVNPYGQRGIYHPERRAYKTDNEKCIGAELRVDTTGNDIFQLLRTLVLVFTEKLVGAEGEWCYRIWTIALWELGGNAL